MVRLFIALNLTSEQLSEINALQSRMKQYLAGVRWVSQKTMHLTIKFLGECREEKIAEIKSILERVAAENYSYKIRYGTAGVFPNAAKTRILWVGLQEGATETIKIAVALDNILGGSGFLKETRDYHPHLTLGRLRYPQREHETIRFLNDEKDFVTSRATIDRITLYESRIAKHGLQYHSICEAKLSCDQA